MKKVRMCCGACGGENVVADAWASWDEDTQDWVVKQTFDASFCEDCECETSMEEVEIDAGEFSDVP